MCEIHSLDRHRQPKRPGTRNEQHCADCNRWTSRASAEGYCPACAKAVRNQLAQVYSIARAARGDDMDPLDGGPDDPPNPPAA